MYLTLVAMEMHVFHISSMVTLTPPVSSSIPVEQHRSYTFIWYQEIPSFVTKSKFWPLGSLTNIQSIFAMTIQSQVIGVHIKINQKCV